jgi:hypothetical protein
VFHAHKFGALVFWALEDSFLSLLGERELVPVKHKQIPTNTRLEKGCTAPLRSGRPPAGRPVSLPQLLRRTSIGRA